MINLILYFEEEDKSTIIQLPTKGVSRIELIKKIKSTGIELPNNPQLIINDSELKSDEETYKFNDNDTLTIRESKNLEGFGFNLEEIKEDKFIQEKVTDDPKIPKWLTVKPGLNLVGICTNKNCEAYDKEVIEHINSNKSDLSQNNGLMKCPICGFSFAFKNICLYHCYYNFYGIKYVKKKVEDFGKEIKDFDNCIIDDDDKVDVDGEKYKIYKTNPHESKIMLLEGKEVTYIKLFFQIRFFDF